MFVSSAFACGAPFWRFLGQAAGNSGLSGQRGPSVTTCIILIWKMSFSKAFGAPCFTVHEQLASPGVSSTLCVICDLEIQEKSWQNGRAEGLYLPILTA